MSQQRPRHRFSPHQLFFLYLAIVCTGGVAGAVTGGVGLLVMSALSVGCRPAGGDALPGADMQCPDGTGKLLPALLLVGLGCLVVLSAAAVLISRRADAATIARIARHALWLATGVVAVPALIWVSLVFTSAATAGGIWGVAASVFAATVFVAIPLITSYVWPARTTTVLAACLAVPVVVVLVGWWLPLLVPIGMPLAAIWLIALWLLRAARRVNPPASPTEVPSVSRRMRFPRYLGE
ncbi:adenylate cyclase [Salinispora oceanensis]|uniref:adenylate cyclase n=1 Tax=Salinispora oceanensis TaxID=1050199 RepID=UPI0003AACF2A|nr:adenylate cyclase [Salinispora oceanensis]